MATERHRRKRKRKAKLYGLILRVLMPVFFISALTVGAIIFFKLETITVQGEDRYTEEQILIASRLTQGQHLFLIDKSEVGDKISSQLPYIQSAKISLRLPEGIAIIVEEEKAIFEIHTQDSKWLMGQNGKLLEQTDFVVFDTSMFEVEQPVVMPLSYEEIVVEPVETVIILSGLSLVEPTAGAQITVVQEHEQGFHGISLLLETMSEHGMMESVHQIHLGDYGEIEMDYLDRFLVIIPIDCDFDYKIRALVAAVAQLESYESGTLDLTRTDCAVLYIPS